MSTAEMVVLLEEGAHGSTELAARAAAGATAAGEVAEHAQALGLKAVEEAERLHREYVEAVTAIQHAAEQAAHAGETAAHAVESVSAETTKAAEALKNMLVTVEGDAFHMGEERARLFHALDESAKKTETAFHDLAGKVEAFDEHVTARIKDSEEALKHVHDRVEQAAGRILEAQKELHDQFEKLGSVAAETMGEVVHALDQTLSAIANGMVEFANEGIVGHNQVTAAVRHGYLDQTKEDPVQDHTYLETAFDTVREAVAGFAMLPEPAHASLQAPTEAIVEAGEKTANSLGDTIRNLQHSLEVVTA